jgi:hypothetical protein
MRMHPYLDDLFFANNDRDSQLEQRDVVAKL